MVVLALQQGNLKRDLAKLIAGAADVKVARADAPLALLREISSAPPNILVLETSFVRASARVTVGELTATLRRICPSTLVVLYSPQSGEGDAAAVEAGVHYYAVDVTAEGLADVVRSMLETSARREGLKS